MAQVANTHLQAQDGRRRITLEAYMELLDEQPYEVINGELIPMAPQQLRSSRIAHDLLFSIEGFVKGKKLGRVWTETVYALDVDQRTGWLEGSLVPDVSFTSQQRLDEQLARYGEEGPLRIVPDLVVEIISPIDKFSYVMKKVALYLGFGVRLVWVIDPQNRTVRVMAPDDPDGRTLGESDTLTGDPVLPGWSYSVAELLGPKTES